MSTIDLNSKRIQPGDATFNAIQDTLQGNILKSHGREQAAHIFLNFQPGKHQEARQFLAALDLTTVAGHEDQKQARSAGNEQMATFLYLTCAGYRYLQVSEEHWPQDSRFQAGLKESASDLSDNPATWAEELRGDIHAMIILAYSGELGHLSIAVDNFKNFLAHAGLATVLSVEMGLALKQKVNGSFTDEHIEHFNYVDGISQPLFFDENIEVLQWDPFQPLGLVLVPEPGSAEDVNYGSYLVFRKLEQNVREFKRAELKTAESLGLSNPELAGAMVVGRFENGSPVTVSEQENHPLENNFNYDTDEKGARCPFHAHIRKTNPRGETEKRQLGKASSERTHMVARRGITYGHREVHPGDVPHGDFDVLPENGVGLLFMCFQSDIEQQFEFIQRLWANNDQFISPDTGLDIVIGQGNHMVPHKYAKEYGKLNSITTSTAMMQSFVTMKGGEYFFAPSVPFIRTLAMNDSANVIANQANPE